MKKSQYYFRGYLTKTSMEGKKVNWKAYLPKVQSLIIVHIHQTLVTQNI